MDDLSKRKYIDWHGVENKPANEDEDIQAAANLINTMQKAQFDNHRHCYTGTHVRTQGIVKGTFEVSEDLPQYLKQGPLFEKAGVYPVAARYSTETGAAGIDDRIPQPRGFAMKLFNVQGEMFEDGKDWPTQDIEFNNTPALELADAKTTKEILDLRVKYDGDTEGLYRQLEKRNDTELQKARDQVSNYHVESMKYYSQTAYRFGDYVMKYALVPTGEAQKRLQEEEVSEKDPSDVLSRWMQKFYADNTAEYEFKVQLCENLEEQPVEYAGVSWDETKYPFVKVATVKFPPQDSFDYHRKAFWEDHMRLDPWHGLKAYQPLGSPNRLRKGVYPASSALRRKLNGRTEINVTSIDEVP